MVPDCKQTENDNQELEIDLREFAERGEAVPHAGVYRVRIDDETVKVHTPCPTGEELLQKVGKRPCGFELIAEFYHHHENSVIEPEEKDGPPLPLPPNLPVKICGCETFHTQAQSGGSS